MRPIPFFVSLLLSIALIWALDRPWGKAPAMGAFLSPQHGFWQNAEDTAAMPNIEINAAGLKAPVELYFDERLVPHIFAQSEVDAYFAQGYVHAKHRLWQMEFQTHYAAGRLSEILGPDPRLLRVDREQRRMGMVWAAERSLAASEGDARTKAVMDAYTAGVNAYIAELTPATLPIEYKLLGYQPEPWSNLKISLFLKLMTKDLAGWDRDQELTRLASLFAKDEIAALFPDRADSTYPIIPKGKPFAPPGITPVAPAEADSVMWGQYNLPVLRDSAQPDRDNGSNSWAVTGSKSATGAPILCNDPHLGLSLPSLWYEMQITTPEFTTYGATFPGSPAVIIGFNDSAAFGFTNAQRDVKDYYEIKYRDGGRNDYRWNDGWRSATQKVERIRVKGGADLLDTVVYTHWGPVMWDDRFSSDIHPTQGLALRWTGHEPTNELLVFLKLAGARTTADYETAISTFGSPGQNMLFATKSGDIALWQQGLFPARWAGQGATVMPGWDSSFAWQGWIPQAENPHVVNPPSGYIQSANQRPVDTTYPYFIPGQYIHSRGMRLERLLRADSAFTPQDMMAMQLDLYNYTAESALPLLFRWVDSAKLDNTATNALAKLRAWNMHMEPGLIEPGLYQTWLDSLQKGLWSDEWAGLGGKLTLPKPDDFVALETLHRDSNFAFIDDVRTPQQETIRDLVTVSFVKAVETFFEDEKPQFWGDRGFGIKHLLRDAVPSFGRNNLIAGGWNSTLNAIKITHGPSWRMIVHLTDETEAYGIFPGGQSGNPGSKNYDAFVDDWIAGKYYKLWVMKPTDKTSPRITGRIQFKPA